MAHPRVFLSSTCYDLSEVRDRIKGFVQDMGYEIVLSERGDVFYHPDLHTHESCVHEIRNADLFILIVGGRFGGRYKLDTTKSIVNAEFEAAKNLRVPVFTFIKEDVYHDHLVYEKNKNDEATLKKILFPSVEKNEHAARIFEFIDQIRLAPCNNGVFPFKTGGDVQDTLTKQWAGMFHGFLQARLISKDLATTNNLIASIQLAQQKTEELLELVLKRVDSPNADKEINTINEELEAGKFFLEAFSPVNTTKKFSKSTADLMKINPKVPWYDFLVETGDFHKSNHVLVGGEKRYVDLVAHTGTKYVIADIRGDRTPAEIKKEARLSTLYKKFQDLSDKKRARVLEKFSADA